MLLNEKSSISSRQLIPLGIAFNPWFLIWIATPTPDNCSSNDISAVALMSTLRLMRICFHMKNVVCQIIMHWNKNHVTLPWLLRHMSPCFSGSPATTSPLSITGPVVGANELWTDSLHKGQVMRIAFSRNGVHMMTAQICFQSLNCWYLLVLHKVLLSMFIEAIVYSTRNNYYKTLLIWSTLKRHI